MGSQDVGSVLKVGGAVDQSGLVVFANPMTGSPLQPIDYVNLFSGTNGT